MCKICRLNEILVAVIQRTRHVHKLEPVACPRDMRIPEPSLFGKAPIFANAHGKKVGDQSEFSGSKPADFWWLQVVW